MIRPNQVGRGMVTGCTSLFSSAIFLAFQLLVRSAPRERNACVGYVRAVLRESLWAEPTAAASATHAFQR